VVVAIITARGLTVGEIGSIDIVIGTIVNVVAGLVVQDMRRPRRECTPRQPGKPVTTLWLFGSVTCGCLRLFLRLHL